MNASYHNFDEDEPCHSIPFDILDDLCSRFIINVPREDRENLVRICFHIELAHWFYLDYYCNDETSNMPLNPCGIREFAAHIFQHVPELRIYASSVDEVLDMWRDYKLKVPTYGAILLDEDLSHVLLVQSYWAKCSWGFPKGKVNEREEPWKCAAREVLEETGFDITKWINRRDYIEAVIHEQVVRLYIVAYVPRDTQFRPRTRCEIRACQWFPLADLPQSRKDITPKLKMGVAPKSFYMVMPFVKRVRRWVSERVADMEGATRQRHKSTGDIDHTNRSCISQGLENEIQDYQRSQRAPAAVGSGYKQSRVWYGPGVARPPAGGSGRYQKKPSKRQLFTPQTSPGRGPAGFQPIEPEDNLQPVPSMEELLNFVAPSWADFKFDLQAILDSISEDCSPVNS